MNNITDWNADRFIEEYARYKGNPTLYFNIKSMRSKVFENTVSLVGAGAYINEKGESVPLNYENAGTAVFFSKEIRNDPADALPHEKTCVEIKNMDCMECAIDMTREGYTPAVLNMASGSKPGGGVISGAGAQEESLFRRTDLFRSLYQFAPWASRYGLKQSPNQYPLDRDFGGIYTPKALIFRESEADGYRLLDSPVAVSVISVPGINRPELTSDGLIADYLVPRVKNKIRTIFRMGVRFKHDALVLSALGCGAFKNPPRHVAKLFHEVMREPEFAGQFKKIVFAILDDHNAHRSHNPDGNFGAFEYEFRSGI